MMQREAEKLTAMDVHAILGAASNDCKRKRDVIDGIQNLGIQTVEYLLDEHLDLSMELARIFPFPSFTVTLRAVYIFVSLTGKLIY